MGHAWSKVRQGAASPWLVLKQARTAGAPWGDYRRLVLLHLVLATAVMAVAAPFVMKGVHAAQHQDDRAAKRKRSALDAAVDKATKGKTYPLDQAVAAARAVSTTLRADDEDESPALEPSDAPHDTMEASPDEDDAPPSFLVTHAPSLISVWIALGSLYFTWILVELAISMVWMEHLDRLTERLTQATGMPVLQPMPDEPRLRFSIRWALQKGWRQIVGALMIASGAPFFALVLLAPGFGAKLYAVLLALWSFYWFMITTTAKSASAWAIPAPHPPWFLRAWGTTTTRVFGFRWFMPRAYGSLWTRLTRALHPAAAMWEARPYELLGLALVRVTAQLPFLSLAIKPLLPTAAELIVSGKLDEPATPPT